MGILSKYYEKNELDNILKEVNVTDVDNPKFMNIVMKMICSFGKKRPNCVCNDRVINTNTQ